MTIDVCVQIGRRIRLLRTEKGISQDVLADQSQLSRVNLSRIETGAAEPGIRTLMRIAAALDVKVCDLIDNLTLD